MIVEKTGKTLDPGVCRVSDGLSHPARHFSALVAVECEYALRLARVKWPTVRNCSRRYISASIPWTCGWRWRVGLIARHVDVQLQQTAASGRFLVSSFVDEKGEKGQRQQRWPTSSSYYKDRRTMEKAILRDSISAPWIGQDRTHRNCTEPIAASRGWPQDPPTPTALYDAQAVELTLRNKTMTISSRAQAVMTDAVFLE